MRPPPRSTLRPASAAPSRGRYLSPRKKQKLNKQRPNEKTYLHQTHHQSMKSSFYTEYYQNTLQYRKGFKLVLGGTGLGKTSGIVEILKKSKRESKRFFYMANRLQLLNELKADLEKENKKLEEIGEKPIGFCLQKRDIEIISEITQQQLEHILENPIIQKYATKIYKRTGVSPFNTIKNTFKFIKGNPQLAQSDTGSDILREYTGKIFSFFRNIIKMAAESQKDYTDLVRNSIIKILFPYIDFKNNPTDKRIFIVSLQKAFYGFFDGKQSVNLYKLKNDEEHGEQNIIFLDEFDFLENDLLTQICKDISIEQPFSFVEYFYNVLTKYKLPRTAFLENRNQLREKLEEVIESVKSISEKYHLPFPQINHFLCKENKLKNTAIFQTRYSIGNYPIHLNHKEVNQQKEKINAFFLELATEENKPNAYVLLNVVNQATSAIIRIFKELEFDEPEVYRALVAHCFGTSDTYKSILKRIRQHPNRRKAVSTNESKMYYNGFGLYEIFSFNYPTDSEEVELKYYSLFTTPESILLHLTKNNLVFGLSATAEIDRYVKNFDLDWLKNELGENFYKTENRDIEIIQKANKTKFEKRQNQINVEIASEVLPEQLGEFVEKVVHTNEILFGKGKQEEYRKKRVTLFFSTLQWAAKNQRGDNTHLLFFSSYKQILFFFEEVQEPEIQIYKIRSKENKSLKNHYQINFQGFEFTVLFLNAEQGKAIAKFEKNKRIIIPYFGKASPFY